MSELNQQCSILREKAKFLTEIDMVRKRVFEVLDNRRDFTFTLKVTHPTGEVNRTAVGQRFNTLSTMLDYILGHIKSDILDLINDARSIEDELRAEIERLKPIIDSGRKGMGIDELESVLKTVEEENEVLTDSLRWRKYPEEKPGENSRYYMMRKGKGNLPFMVLPHQFKEYRGYYWLPIPPIGE